MKGEIEVVNYTENEDGTGNLEVKVDRKAQEMLFDLGMQMILLCATFEVTTDEVIKKIIEVYEDDHAQT